MNKLPNDYDATKAIKAIKLNLKYLTDHNWHTLLDSFEDCKGRWILKFKK